MRPKPILIAASLIAAAAALVMTGCYSFTGVTLSKTKLKASSGKRASRANTSNVKVYSVPSPNDDDGGDVFFLLIGLPDDNSAGAADDSLKPSAGVFDAKSVFLNHPRDLERNNAIRDALVSDGGCGEFDFSQIPYSFLNYYVFATENRVPDTGPHGKQALATAKIKQVSPVDSGGAPNPSQNLVAVGSWDDDGDEIPETNGDDALSCAGGSDPSIYRQFASAKAEKRVLQKARAKYGTDNPVAGG